MMGSIFDWRAIEEAIKLNGNSRGDTSERVLKPIARDLIEELHIDKNIAMSVLLQNCQGVLSEVNSQYLAATRAVPDSYGRWVKGNAPEKLILKREFFTFMLGWIEKSTALDSVWSSLDIICIERDWDVVAFDGDWAIIGDADFA
ncbi:hypothetical protein QBC41DRAFT_390699 [Cercophora samala]|uniref:Uncharacterized protein n=1 Tax=Cercophora samala TaxID=330535 RepID=A0AA40DDB7_9PEZI|nr:hypothetical protein QBC41DRAFT_390699 [Cercophora samala]